MLTDLGMNFHVLTRLRKYTAHSKFQQTNITLPKCTLEDISDSCKVSIAFSDHILGGQSRWPTLYSHGMDVFLHLSNTSDTVSYSNLVHKLRSSVEYRVDE